MKNEKFRLTENQKPRKVCSDGEKNPRSTNADPSEVDEPPIATFSPVVKVRGQGAQPPAPI